MRGMIRTHFPRVSGSVLIAVFVCMSAPIASAQSTDLMGIAHVALRVNDLQKSRDFYNTLASRKRFHLPTRAKCRSPMSKSMIVSLSS